MVISLGEAKKYVFSLKFHFSPFVLPTPSIMDPPVMETRTVTLYERSYCDVTHQTQPQPLQWRVACTNARVKLCQTAEILCREWSVCQLKLPSEDAG